MLRFLLLSRRNKGHSTLVLTKKSTFTDINNNTTLASNNNNNNNLNLKKLPPQQQSIMMMDEYIKKLDRLENNVKELHSAIQKVSISLFGCVLCIEATIFILTKI